MKDKEPIELNELQVERVLFLWQEFKNESISEDEYNRFIDWLESR